LETCEPIHVSRLPQTSPAIFVVQIVTLPQRDGRVCDWRTRYCIGEKCERLFTRRLENESRIRNQHKITRRKSAAFGFEQICAGRQFAFHSNLFAERLVSVAIIEVFRPRLEWRAARSRNPLNPRRRISYAVAF